VQNIQTYTNYLDTSLKAQIVDFALEIAGEHHHSKLHTTPHIIQGDQLRSFVQLYLAFYEGIMCWFDWFEVAP
jgi:hypothetical protein